MSQLSDRDLQEIIEREMPGYKVVQRRDRAAADSGLQAEADEIGPEIEELRKKYLGEDAVDAADAREDQDDDEAEMVVVQPKEATDPFDPSSQPKTVVVSGKDRRIIGSQG
jgi:hypothetical protein